MAPAPPFSSYLQPTTRPLSHPHSRWEGHSHPSSPTDNQGQRTGNGDLPEGKHGRVQLPGHQRGYGPQPGPTGAQDAECRQDQESLFKCFVVCKFFYTVAFFKKSGRPQAVQHCPLASPHKATAASGPLDSPGARRPGSLKTAHPRPPLQASPAPQGQGGFQLSNRRGKTGEGQRGHVVCCYQQGALGPQAGGGYLDTRLAEPFPAVTPGCPPGAPTLLPRGRSRVGPGAAKGSEVSYLPVGCPTPCPHQPLPTVGRLQACAGPSGFFKGNRVTTRAGKPATFGRKETSKRYPWKQPGCWPTPLRGWRNGPAPPVTPRWGRRSPPDSLCFWGQR